MRKISTKNGVAYSNVIGAVSLWATTVDAVNAAMYAICVHIGNTKEIVRSWKDYNVLLDKIVEEYGDKESGARVVLYTPVLSYWWGWSEYHHEWQEVFGPTPGQPRRACDQRGIEYRCIEQLSGAKVETVAEKLLVPARRLGEYDITKMRGADTSLAAGEAEYMHAYTQVCVDYVQQVMREEHSNAASIRWTLTSDLRNYMKKMTVFSKYGDSYRKRVHAINISTEEYALLKEAQRGGMVYATPYRKNRELTDVSSWDISSSYAAVMCAYEYPCRSLGVVDCDYTFYDMCEFRKHHKFVVGMCEFRGFVADSGVRYLKAEWCHDIVNGRIDSDGYVVAADAISVVLTNVDCECMRFHVEDGGYFTCYRAARWKTSYLPHQFVYAVLSLYKRKTEYKDVAGKELEYRRSKAMLSSIFGDSAMDPVQRNVSYGPDRKWVRDEESLEDKLDAYNRAESRYNFFGWGVAVTAYARLRLVEMIEQIDAISKDDGVVSDFCYCDTDCTKLLDGQYYEPVRQHFNKKIAEQIDNVLDILKIDREMARPTDPHGIKHQLGAWEDETAEVVNTETGEIIDKRYKKFKILGTKRYIYQQFDDDGDLQTIITVAGCNKKKGSLYFSKIGFEGFTEEAVVPGEYSGFVTARHVLHSKGTFTDHNGDEQVFEEHGLIVRELTDYNFSRDALAEMLMHKESIRCSAD